MTIQGINFFTHGIKPPEDMQSLQGAQGTEGVEGIEETSDTSAAQTQAPSEQAPAISMDMGVDEEPMLDLEHLKKGFQQE